MLRLLTPSPKVWVPRCIESASSCTPGWRQMDRWEAPSCCRRTCRPFAGSGLLWKCHEMNNHTPLVLSSIPCREYMLTGNQRVRICRLGIIEGSEVSLTHASVIWNHKLYGGNYVDWIHYKNQLSKTSLNLITLSIILHWEIIVDFWRCGSWVPLWFLALSLVYTFELRKLPSHWPRQFSSLSVE